MDKKTKVLNQITLDGFPSKEVAVDIQTFFEDNNDLSSIGPNLDPQPKPSDFYSIFKKIKSLDKTENIFIRIADADDTEWFYTDAVYIIGQWTSEEISELVKDLRPDEIHEGWMYSKPVNIPDTNNKVFTLWWD